MKCYFEVDGIPHRIYVSLDNCHMLKLVRNNWAQKTKLLNDKNEEIDWQFVEKLYRFQLDQKISICPKVTKQHIQFQKNKIKVKLAAQVLSCSVANGLQYMCDDRKHPDFQNSSATAEFIQLFNDLFDVFNR